MQDEIEVSFAPALPPKNPIQMSQDFSIKSLDEEIPYSQIQEFGWLLLSKTYFIWIIFREKL